MPFEFIVNNATIDRRARKLIRSHAAKGKNVGKTLPPRKKLPARKDNPKAFVHSKDLQVDKAHDPEIEELVPTIERQIGDGLSVLALSDTLTPRYRGFIQRVISFLTYCIFPPELRATVDFSGTGRMWIQLIFTDEAYFHCAVAVSVAVAPAVLVHQADYVESLVHLSRTLRLVNEKLRTIDATSNTTMATIALMGQYERLRGQHSQGLVHLDGLRRMVDLRGGIKQLSKEMPEIAQKIFRADLELALHQGSPTRFGVGDIYGTETIMWLRGRFEQAYDRCFYDPRVFKELTSGIHDVLLDVTSLAWFLNGSGGRGGSLDGESFHSALLLLGYRLIELSPLGGLPPTRHMEQIVHLGLVAFMASLLLGLGRTHPGVPLLVKITRSAAFDHVGEDIESRELLLWLLVIGRVTKFSEIDDLWLVRMTREAVLSLGLETWDDVLSTISKFPWVHCLHDKPGNTLWQATMSDSNASAGNGSDILISAI